MKNPGDKTVPKRTIKKWQKKFRVLVDWEINYIEEKYPAYPDTFVINGLCTLNSKTKKANIYPCPEKAGMDHYIFHEMLHIAFKAVGRSLKKEEITVQDICKIICETGLVKRYE
jgi:hypothetical protein